ncbi:MAG TPA: choice-of-anchor O protein [Gammaproteobacteria bacterium]
MKLTAIAAMIGTLAIGSPLLADDGEQLLRSMSKPPGQPNTDPVSEAEHAFIDVIYKYVPAVGANGEPVTIQYNNVDGELVEERTFAKPLVGVYMYGPAETLPGIGFVGHGKRDAFAAVSLDDGTTWKQVNLSESADESSSDVIREDIALFESTDYAYPGDVTNVFQATAGTKTIAVWQSRYCSSGQPNYSLETSDPARRDAIAAYLGIDLATPSSDDLYLVDMFGVAGQQGSVDYSEDRFEQNQVVGEVPFNCLWSARGTLELQEDGTTYDIVWRKAERLTSGRRDVNRVEASCVANVGCSVTWQEDPEGLRPGQGEGPGEGWSGAVANSQTDVWYSFIPWNAFDMVQAEDGTTIVTLADYLAAGNTAKPQVGVPMAMPMRLTDNARCNVNNPQPYCNGSAISANFPDLLNPLDYGLPDMCASTVQIPTGPQGTLASICVTEKGLPLVGNIAATRPRLGMFGYDSNKDGVYDGGWVLMVAEESKGLGSFLFTADGTPCTEEGVDGCELADVGKNMWYYSFDMSLFTGTEGKPNKSIAARNTLLANLGGHGNMLNQPETDWRTGLFYPVLNTEQMWDFGDFNYDIYRTEIARRGSLLAQDSARVDKTQAKGGLTALPTWKQGIMEQGGPADVMVRRIVLPKGYKEGSDNPYDFRNMECGTWAYRDGSNAFYPDGLCLSPAVNLSSVVPDSCTDSQAPGTTVACPSVDPASGIGDTDPILQGGTVEPNTTKVLSWHQCPATFTTVSGATVSCEKGDTNLADQSWYNPLDVAKGHRGYLDGDFVMMLYAWSPNWRLNADGHDRYELYIRRSFDGGASWTTLPKNYKHFDKSSYSGAGTVTCETFRSAETGGGGTLEEPHVCNSYAAGDAEQARNVTQHQSMRITTLDPRYTPTGGEKKVSFTDPNGFPEEDTRDPSRYFIVYETGDNTTTIDGEPIPLDLLYGRAVMFGDHYQVWAEEDDVVNCYPSNTMGDTTVPAEVVGSGFCNEFDALEGKQDAESSEASLEANPGGEFMYGVWAQHEYDEVTEELTESDAMFRRVWYIDDCVSSEVVYDAQ